MKIRIAFFICFSHPPDNITVIRSVIEISRQIIYPHPYCLSNVLIRGEVFFECREGCFSKKFFPQ